jgi:hypothetical protein
VEGVLDMVSFISVSLGKDDAVDNFNSLSFSSSVSTPFTSFPIRDLLVQSLLTLLPMQGVPLASSPS